MDQESPAFHGLAGSVLRLEVVAFLECPDEEGHFSI
jgi:hypothetical protein